MNARLAVLVSSLAVAIGCGGATSTCPTIDQDALADRIVERFFQRAREEAERLQAEASTDGAAGAADEPDLVRSAVPIDDAPARGAAEPLVTIVQFSDFQCPFCSRVVPTLERLLREHPEVRLVFRHNPLPFHPRATPAARATIEARAQGGDAKFWAMHDRLFSEGTLEDDDLERHARAIGLDVGKFRRAMASGAHDDVIERDQALAMRLGAAGTPAHFIDGRQLMGAQPYEAFEAMVEEELGVARALVEGGTPRAQLYERLLAAPVPAGDPE